VDYAFEILVLKEAIFIICCQCLIYQLINRKLVPRRRSSLSFGRDFVTQQPCTHMKSAIYGIRRILTLPHQTNELLHLSRRKAAENELFPTNPSLEIHNSIMDCQLKIAMHYSIWSECAVQRRSEAPTICTCVPTFGSIGQLLTSTKIQSKIITVISLSRYCHLSTNMEVSTRCSDALHRACEQDHLCSSCTFYL
jgi:hypothetical protein